MLTFVSAIGLLIVSSLSPWVIRMYPGYPSSILLSVLCSSSKYPLMLIMPPKLRTLPKSAVSNATVPPWENPNRNILGGFQLQSLMRCSKSLFILLLVFNKPFIFSGCPGGSTICIVLVNECFLSCLLFLHSPVSRLKLGNHWKQPSR